MLSRENRISKTEYPTLLKQSRYFVVDGITIKHAISQKGPKFSIIVSAKVSKKAVQRNLIRRILNEKIKETDLGGKIGKKALFIYVSKEFGAMSRTKINQKADELINKICLYFQKS
jgi:ribonuclease P protein component